MELKLSFKKIITPCQPFLKCWKQISDTPQIRHFIRHFIRYLIRYLVRYLIRYLVRYLIRHLISRSYFRLLCMLQFTNIFFICAHHQYLSLIAISCLIFSFITVQHNAYMAAFQGNTLSRCFQYHLISFPIIYWSIFNC